MIGRCGASGWGRRVQALGAGSQDSDSGDVYEVFTRDELSRRYNALGGGDDGKGGQAVTPSRDRSRRRVAAR